MIFILNKNKELLSPCHEAVARKLLKAGKAGSFDIKNKEGKRISINKKYFKVLQRTDGYEYSTEKCGIPPGAKATGLPA